MDPTEVASARFGDLVPGGRRRAVSQNARCDEGTPVSLNAGYATVW